MASIARKQDVDVADIEIWFADQARVGQKNKITRRWARRGSRPWAPSDQRTASTYIFGAICRAALAAIAADVAPGRHAGLLLDQAGWHLSPKLAVPDNITIVPRPAKCPELNAQENVWQFMRDNWLSNHVSDDTDALLDYCCDAWNKLEARPWVIMSLGLRRWAHGF